MSHSLIKKFEEVVFYILSAIIVLYIAVEIIELVYQFGKALLTAGDTTTRLLVTKEQTALVLPSQPHLPYMPLAWVFACFLSKWFTIWHILLISRILQVCFIIDYQTGRHAK